MLAICREPAARSAPSVCQAIAQIGMTAHSRQIVSTLRAYAIRGESSAYRRHCGTDSSAKPALLANHRIGMMQFAGFFGGSPHLDQIGAGTGNLVRMMPT